MRWSIGWKLTGAFLAVTILSVGISGAAFFNMTRNELLGERRVAILTQANMAAVSVARGATAADLPPAGIGSGTEDGHETVSGALVHQLSLQIGARLLVLDPAGQVQADSAAGPGGSGAVGGAGSGDGTGHEPGRGAGTAPNKGAGDGTLVGMRITHHLVGEAAAGGQNTALDRIDGGSWAMYAAVPIVQNQQVTGILFVSQSIEDIAETLQALARRLAAAMGGSILVVIGAGVIIGRRISAPLGEMTRAAGAMARGDLDQRVRVKGDDELATLARAFNHMAGRLAGAEMARRRFIGDASHEMRTPLATIKLIADNLAAETSDAHLLPSLEAIDRQVDRLSGVVESLLVLTRLDQLAAAEGTITKEGVDLRRLLERVAADMEPAAVEKGVALTVTFREAPQRRRRSVGTNPAYPEGSARAPARGRGSGPLWLDADEEGLYRVFRNLLDNGLRYTPAGGRVAVTCRTGSVPDGRHQARPGYIIEVADDGPGIAPEHLERIFERFYRADAARTREEGGFGLGLAIAHEIVSLHGGRISAASAPGAGTVFTVWLPISNL